MPESGGPDGRWRSALSAAERVTGAPVEFWRPDSPPKNRRRARPRQIALQLTFLPALATHPHRLRPVPRTSAANIPQKDLFWRRPLPWAARSYVGWRCRCDSSEIMAKLNPFKFLQEVRQETNKVTWPSRKETGITTAMVFIFAALSAIFFLLADQVIRIAVPFVLGIGGKG